MTDQTGKSMNELTTDRVTEFLRRELPLILCLFASFALSEINGPKWSLFVEGKAKTPVNLEQQKEISQVMPISLAGNIIVSLSLLCFVSFAILLLLRKDPFVFASVARETPEWGFLLVIKFFVYFLFLNELGLFVVGLLLNVGQFNVALKGNVRFIMQTIAELLTVMWCLFVLRGISRCALRAAGFVSYRWTRNILAGIFCFFAVLPVLNFIGSFFVQDHLALKNFADEKSIFMTVALFVCVAVVVPVAEEVFFRGILQGAFKRHLGTVAAVFLSAFVFAYPHGVSALVPIFVFGLILGIVFERTGSIVSVATMHILNNSLTLISTKGL